MAEESKQKQRDDRGGEDKNSLWRAVIRIFSDNPTLVLTILYLYVTAVGIIYAATLYGKFGINIFDYSEVADFLLAAFKNPISFASIGLLATIGSAFLVFITIRMRSGLRVLRAQAATLMEHEKTIAIMHPEKSPTEPSAKRLHEIDEKVIHTSQEARENLERQAAFMEEYLRNRMVLYVTAFLVALISTSLILPWYAAASTASSIKRGERPAVDVRYRSFKGSAGQVTAPGLELIGATQKASFFYDADAERTIVIPQAQIVSIEVPE